MGDRYMSDIKIISKYAIDNTVVGYCIELGSVEEARKCGVFYSLYTEGNKVYVSYTNTDVLRNLGVLSHTNASNIKVIDVYAEAISHIKNGCSETIYKSNHKMAKAYEAKAKLLNLPYRLEYILLPDDEVKLLRVDCRRDLREISIPSFITSYHIEESIEHEITASPFQFSKIRSISIQNKPGRPLSLKGVFSNMLTRELKVRILHPECVYDIFGAFSGNDTLVEVDLGEFTGDNLVSMYEAFAYCYCLETVKLDSFKPKRLIDVRGMFAQCHSLKRLEAPYFNVENIPFREDIFYGAGKCE